VIDFLRKRRNFLLALGIAATGAGIVCADFLPTNWSRMEALAKKPEQRRCRPGEPTRAEPLATVAEQQAGIDCFRLEVEDLTLRVGWLDRID
jgi:hypothetical protein